MPWSEAFRRASNNLLRLILWAFLAEIVMAAGVVFIGSALEELEARRAAMVLGIGLALWGWALISGTGLAVWLKATTDAVADHVEDRIAPYLGRVPRPPSTVDR